MYRPRARTADELAPLVSELLAPEGIAVADPGSGALVLRGPARGIQEALRLLEELDRAPRSWAVELHSTTREALRDRGLEIEGWVERGGVRIGRLGPGGSGARIVFRRLETEGEGQFRGRVVVREGGEAELWTGVLLPARIRVFERETGEERIVETTGALPVQSGFRVRPRGLEGGEVELEIAPVLAEPAGGGVVQETGLTTRVRLRPGEVVALAGLEQGARTGEAGWPGQSSSLETSAETLLVVSVEALGAED